MPQLILESDDAAKLEAFLRDAPDLGKYAITQIKRVEPNRNRQIEVALDAVWCVLTEAAADSPYLQAMEKKLKEEHQVLAELDEFGIYGVAGVGLGRHGGHSV